MIRKITPQGVVTTFAGVKGPAIGEWRDGNGSNARFWDPHGLTVDADGNVYVADGLNNAIRKITPQADVSTVAGSNLRNGSINGNALTLASFNYPSGVVRDSKGNLFVADTSNNLIRKITPEGVVSTFSDGNVMGNGIQTAFNEPQSLAIDSKDNLYVADTYGHTIQKITPDGVVSILAGKFGISGAVDGTGESARFNAPFGIAVDKAGNLFVTELGNHVVRVVTQGGVVFTLIGRLGVSGSTLGDLPGLLTEPRGIAFYGNTMYISFYNGIVKVEPK